MLIWYKEYTKGQFLDPVTAIVGALVLAGFVIRLVYTSRAATRSRMLQAYSQRVGLALVAEIVPELSTRLFRRERAAIFGSMAGLIIGLTAVVGMDGTRSPWNSLFLIVAVVVGSTVALLGNDSRAAFSPVAEEPRLARTSAPRLADYVTALDRAFSLSLLTLATLGYIAVLGVIAINPERVFDEISVQSILWPAGLLLALATVATLLTWAAADALVARGQPASTLAELAWSDAFRSTTLRSLVAIPGLIATVSTLVLFQSLSFAMKRPLPGPVDELLAGSFTAMGPVLLIALIMWTLTSLRHRNTTHYLRRLWPDTAAELERGRTSRGLNKNDQPGNDYRTKTPA